MSDTVERSRLGDCCQNHDPVTVPVVYPHTVICEGNSLQGEYRCPECDAEWKCWWDRRAAGWTWGPDDTDDLDIKPAAAMMRRVVESLRPGVRPYPVYGNVQCPVCGATEGHRDHGPYEYHPLDDELGGTPPPTVHAMSCGSCRKTFDAEPEHPGGPVVHRPAYGPSPSACLRLTALPGGRDA